MPIEEDMSWVTGSMVRRLAEMNGEHEFSYSEEELVDLVRSSLAPEAAAQR